VQRANGTVLSDGRRTETKFTKWSVSLERLRIAGVQCSHFDEA